MQETTQVQSAPEEVIGELIAAAQTTGLSPFALARGLVTVDAWHRVCR